MPILPDYLESGLRVVFCGTAAGLKSAERGHYYAGSGNEFWGTLEYVGIIPEPLGPHLDHRVLEFGVGLTDLAKEVAASSDRGLGSSYDVAGFLSKMAKYSPAWVAFHGKTAANAVAKSFNQPTPVSLGRQTWSLSRTNVFVVPSMSGANRDPSRFEGRPSREAWFAELCTLLPPIKEVEVPS